MKNTVKHCVITLLSIAFSFSALHAQAAKKTTEERKAIWAECTAKVKADGVAKAEQQKAIKSCWQAKVYTKK